MRAFCTRPSCPETRVSSRAPQSHVVPDTLAIEPEHAYFHDAFKIPRQKIRGLSTPLKSSVCLRREVQCCHATLSCVDAALDPAHTAACPIASSLPLTKHVLATPHNAFLSTRDPPRGTPQWKGWRLPRRTRPPRCSHWRSRRRARRMSRVHPVSPLPLERETHTVELPW